MSLPVKTGLPNNLDLPSGYTLRFAALDPITGNTVAGVTISNASILATQVAGTPGDLSVGEWVLVPGPE